MKVSGLYKIYPDAPRENDLEQSKPLPQLYENHFGMDSMIWGSDWPFTQYEKQVTFEDSLTLIT